MTTQQFVLRVESSNPKDEQHHVDQILRALGWIYAPDQVTLLDGNYQRLTRTPDGPKQSSGLLVDEIVPDA